MEKQYDIFISYRRLDENGNISGRDQARLIAKQLELEGFDSFFDYSEIKDNEFDKIIIPAIQKCDVFILVLTKNSLNRCINEDDWVRREIETAISSQCKIISVTPDNTFNGWPSTLPSSLEKIKNIQISDIHMGSLFEISVKKLIEDRILQNISSVTKLKKTKKYSYIQSFFLILEILFLGISILIFGLFCVLDLGYEDTSPLIPYYEYILPTYSIYLIITIVGYIKPKLLLCETRKRISYLFLIPTILLTIVGGNIAEDYENDKLNEVQQFSMMTNNFMSIELDKNMFFAKNGNPKQIIEKSSNLEQPMRIKFDSIGRITYKEYGKYLNLYNWSENGKTLECREYQDGKYVGSANIYIHEMNNTHYKYEIRGVIYEVYFNNHGGIEKIKCTYQGSTQHITFFYKKDSPLYPYKQTYTNRNQKMECYFSNIVTDKQGNVISHTQSYMGQINICTSDIIYY